MWARGYDSPGGDIAVERLKKNVTHLALLCNSDPSCRGFTAGAPDAGWLKHTILPVSEWTVRVRETREREFVCLRVLRAKFDRAGVFC